MNEINWRINAIKQIKRIPEQYQKMIYRAVGRLADFPNVQGLDIKALKVHKYDYRLRVSRYRVLFNFKKEIEIIDIMEVVKRNGQTY